MIPVARLDEPRVLAEHKEEWTRAFLEKHAQDPNVRPRSERYAHREVKATLAAMSHHKCFYCEGSTKEEAPEVDHHVEVARRPDLAFEWQNLHLACKGCNQAKKRAVAIPAAECLDPCLPGVDPSEHLAFEDEIIRARDGSRRGLNTIKKYWLDRAELDLRRLRRLQSLSRVVKAIDDARIRDGGRAMTAAELELLRRFAQPDGPFSLMCRHRLDSLLG